MESNVEVKITNFHSVLPPHSRSQEELVDWVFDLKNQGQSLEEPKTESDRRLSQRYLLKPSQISRRYFECEDILQEPTANQKMSIYAVNPQNPHGADIKTRSQVFAEKSWRVFKKIYSDETSQTKPDHLIHVTCTGYTSPSPAQKIVAQKLWEKPTSVTHAYHMGCYAALPAVRMAKAFVQANSAAVVDVVHTEMCGLHMLPSLDTPEQALVQSLFADGHIKYSLESIYSATPGFKVLRVLEQLIPDTEDHMTWQPSAHGMMMTLSRDVPAKIKENIEGFVQNLLKDFKNSKELISRSVFAVHPGGPRIIDVVKEALNLNEKQVEASRKILFERGNMSSATLPHVWQEILEAKLEKNTPVISLAFGPGLTVFGAVFETV